jgi:hypothetical protein
MAHIVYLLQGTHRLVRSKFNHLSRVILVTSKLSYGKIGSSVLTRLPQSTNTYIISHFEIQVIKLTTKPIYSLHKILYIHAVPNRNDATFLFYFMVRYTATVKIRLKMASS